MPKIVEKILENDAGVLLVIIVFRSGRFYLTFFTQSFLSSFCKACRKCRGEFIKVCWCVTSTQSTALTPAARRSWTSWCSSGSAATILTYFPTRRTETWTPWASTWWRTVERLVEYQIAGTNDFLIFWECLFFFFSICVSMYECNVFWMKVYLFCSVSLCACIHNTFFETQAGWFAWCVS